MPRNRTLIAMIEGEMHLRKQAERWDRERRREDRADRKVKDEELNGVRLQLRDQAATFATKEMVLATVAALDKEGTEGFREGEAARRGREEILSNLRANATETATNRRWIVGLAVTVAIFFLAQIVAITLFIARLATTQ